MLDWQRKWEVGESREWDGVSPLNGEPVIRRIEIAGKTYVVTRRACCVVSEKPPTEAQG